MSSISPASAKKGRNWIIGLLAPVTWYGGFLSVAAEFYLNKWRSRVHYARTGGPPVALISKTAIWINRWAPLLPVHTKS